MQKSITINKLKPFIKKISQDFNIYFPIKISSQIKLTNDLEDLDKFYLGIANMPPKKFFLPVFEEMFYNDNQISQNTKNNKKNILFGIHPTDIVGINILDKIFSSHNDFYYKKLRNLFYIISIGDFEYKDNFSCDMFLEINSDVFDVYLKNPALKKILNYKNIFSENTFEKEKIIEEHDPLFKDFLKLSLAVESSYNSPIWDDVAKICLGCGICSFVCPLCYCHEYNDNFTLNNKKSKKRSRQWSSCMHKNFFEISGHNFKPELKDRIYNWYYHKFVRFPRENGHIGCIDCGRCIKECPAKINFKTILKTVISDYEKSIQTRRNKN